MAWASFSSRHVAAALLGTLAAVLVRRAEVGRSVQRACEFWEVRRGCPGGLLYVALGDSAAQGVGASSPERGYVGLLAGRLREATGRDVEVVNLSVSGARVRDVLEQQLPALGALAPDVVTVAVGGNDVRRYERRTFAAEVDRLVAGLPAGTYVADVPWFVRARGGKKAAEAAQTLRAATERAGLVSVPLHEQLRAGGWGGMLRQTSGDLFHPNDRGYEVWADAFWSRMSLDLDGLREGT